MTELESEAASWRQRRRRAGALFRLFIRRYSRVLWALHSVWALLTGIAVLVLAHNRYGFLKWAVLFIALTWGSTLFFARFAEAEHSRAMDIAQSVVSYLTRVMYQETLFFLLPFYFYSTTFPSWNFLYIVLLAFLAILSCFDMAFDRLLRESRLFAVTFFAFVSFSALQFFIPLVLGVRIHYGANSAAVVSFLAAALLAVPAEDLRKPRSAFFIGGGIAISLLMVTLFRPMLPPVPLRLRSITLSTALNPRTLRAPAEFEKEIPLSAMKRGRLYVVATVFSPSRIPARVQVRYVRDGKVVRNSRIAQFNVSTNGFRVWDSLAAPSGGFKPGTYSVEVWTGEGQLVGRKRVKVQ